MKGRILGYVFRAFIALHRTLYRASGGRIGGGRAIPILLLTTSGRRTGRRRTVPVQYLAEGEALVVVASNGGKPSHPAWFLNLRAEPRVEVATGRVRTVMHAREAAEEERQRLWPLLVEVWPTYGKYQRGTTRKLPLVILKRSP